MLERYKLRLRDGTVLVVDHDALSTWLVDGKALVQPVGSERWFPLRQFLAKEKAEAAAAARRNPPPIAPPLPAPPLENGTGLRLVEPPPLPPLSDPPVSERQPLASADEPPVWTSQPPILPSEPEPPVPADEPMLASEPPVAASEPPTWAPEPSVVASEPPVVWAPADEPAVTTRLTTPGDEVSIAEPPSVVEPEAPRFADVPAPPAPPLSESEPPEVWAPDLPEEAPAPEPPEVWAPAEEAAALYQATAQPQAFDTEVTAVTRLPPDEPEAPPLFTAPPPSHSPEPEPIPSESESPEAWAPTEEAAALYQATAELYESSGRDTVRGDEDALWRTAAQAMNERPEPSVRPRNLQVLADATVPSRGKSKAPSPFRDELIPLKALDEEDEASRRGTLSSMVDDGSFEAEGMTRLESSFLGLGPPWDARVSRWLDVLSTSVALLGRGLDRVMPRDPASTAQAFFGRVRGAASSWTESSSAWVERHMRRDEPALSQTATAETVRTASPGPAPLPPRLTPPPPLSELPVIRLAKIDDAEDDPAGHDIYQETGSLDVAWLWLKRIALFAGLLTAGILAASTWESWLPAATQMARALFVEIHEREHAKAPKAEEARQAPVPEPGPAIAEQLPHLAPETIALVMSTSPIDVLDPPEVFARAYDATKRGLPALSAPEAQELGDLQRALLNALLPAERQRVREYDLVVAHRVALPMENRDMLRAFAHGARALPEWARERLQQLSAKAIAAALALPPEAPPRAPAAP